MKHFNWLWMPALVALFFTACNPPDDMVPTPNPDHAQWITLLGSGSGNGSGNDLLCYDIVYPISFILPNGNIKVAENEGQMSGLLHANPSPIEIVFPITLEDEDGNQITVTDEDELQMYLDLCENNGDDWEDIFGDDDLFDCYSIQFPIDVELSDGSVATANDLDELIDLFDNDPYPVAPIYPLTLIDEDGNPVPVNGPDDLVDLADACDDDDEWELGDFECYELGYPINLLLEDGSTATANDPDELAQILTGTPAPVDFSYPVILIDADGNEITVADADELDDLLDACDDDDTVNCNHGLINEFVASLTDVNPDSGCYELVYPLTFIRNNGDEDTIADQTELLDYLDIPGNFAQVKCVVFPVEVVDAVSGDPITIETKEELFDLKEACN